MDLSISIVSWNVKKLLENCLNSIYQNKWNFSFEVIVVDNGSYDDTCAMIKTKFPQVKLFENIKNEGFTKANNFAFRKSEGRYFFLLNPDTVLEANSLNYLVDFLEKNLHVMIAAPKLLNPDNTLQKSCLGFPTLGALVLRNIFIEYIWPKNPWSRKYLNLDMDYEKEQNVDQPMGAALLVRREAYENSGGLDENIHIFFDEVDLCYRIKKSGEGIFYLPKAKIIHYGGQSIKKWSPFRLSHNWNKSRDYYFQKHFGNSSVFILWVSDLVRIILFFVILLEIFMITRFLFKYLI
jgi:GT2 family glycosyltransferase